jgi:hypothetical protein
MAKELGEKQKVDYYGSLSLNLLFLNTNISTEEVVIYLLVKSPKRLSYPLKSLFFPSPPAPDHRPW